MIGDTLLGAGVLFLAGALAGHPAADALPPDPSGPGAESRCVAADSVEVPEAGAPEFYRIELVPTGAIPGTAAVEGSVAVRFPASPFDVALSGEGSFHRRLEVDLSGLRAPRRGGYVVWITPPELEPVHRLGVVGSDGPVRGETAFPKFLVVVTLEEDPDDGAGRWSGPVVFRGMSRSGYMHTMAGHGPFQQEPCAKYGF